MDINSLVNEKLEADTEFQTSISTLSDEEKTAKIEEKKSSILVQEFASLKEKADRAEKAEEIAHNQKIRAEKAEADRKKGAEGINEKKEELSSLDLFALVQAKTHEDDVEEVIKAAKLLGKSVKDALRDDTVKAILKTREEFRATTLATNTKSARPGIKKQSAEDIMSEANKGNIPEKGSQEAEELFWARRGGRK